MERDIMYALAVAFFYNTIREYASKFLGAFLRGLSVSMDIILAIIGYLVYKKYPAYKWLGLGLLFGAVASIGSQGIGGLFQPTAGARVLPATRRALLVEYARALTGR